MVDFRSSKQQEIENLARTLKASRLAHSESEAMRMAEEMLSTSKKVADDFAERDKAMYGAPKRDKDIELAQKAMEQITSNIAKGKPNVRIDIAELDLEKPLKELIPPEEEPKEQDDDDEQVEIKEFPQIEELPKTSTVFEDFQEKKVDDEDDGDDDSEEEKSEDFSVRELESPPDHPKRDTSAEESVDLSKMFNSSK